MECRFTLTRQRLCRQIWMVLYCCSARNISSPHLIANGLYFKISLLLYPKLEWNHFLLNMKTNQTSETLSNSRSKTTASNLGEKYLQLCSLYSTVLCNLVFCSHFSPTRVVQVKQRRILIFPKFLIVRSQRVAFPAPQGRIRE